MAKSRGHLQAKIRAELVQAAARIMAEDGIQDYALAKKKAARQLGVAEIGMLPSNQEILAARNTYQGLFQEQEHRDRVRDLRNAAVNIMQKIARFDPQITGDILVGTAARYAKIELLIFTDNPKEFELFLVNERIAYKTIDKKFRLADQLKSVTCYSVAAEFTEAEITVLSILDFRRAAGERAEHKPIPRVGLLALQALIATPEIQ